jgi:Na+-translocating ferredoxin:NAD+ oxidoreductase RnfG subunit
MSKLAVTSFILQVSFAMLYGSGSDLLNKKERKEIERIFGEGIEATAVTLPLEDSASVAVIHEGDVIVSLSRGGKCQGFLLSTRAKGRFDYFDYSVIFSADLSVQGIMVTAYRSTHGAGICNKKWLEQFKGYSGGEIKLGKEVDSISGATISATSMVSDIQRCRYLMAFITEQPATD